ncbi:hypothetical protein O3M35_007185 [Rhynocoris fuscipes]|uniref:RNA-binding protein 42 n=1 Tax=Rhynocoris fuscipes TaxID=488301 RepID=A0AAW1DB84_9HEMI
MAEINEDKFKQMQDEMSRFEEEIGLPIPDVPSVIGSGPRVISANTYNEAQKQLAGVGPQIDGTPINGMATLVPPPPPPVPFIPHQVRGGIGPNFPLISPMGPGAPIGPGIPITGPGGPVGPGGPLPGAPGPMGGPGAGPLGPPGPPMPPPMMTMPSQYPGPMPPPGLAPGRFIPPPPPVSVPDKPQQPVPAVVSANPMMYVANPQLEIAAIQASSEHSSNFNSLSNDLMEDKKSTKRSIKPAVPTVIETMIPGVNSKKKEKKNKKLIRTAGGQIWEDATLAEWEDDDFRLFCGDLGNDVTDEVLTRAFSKYPSFLKARVVRDKRTNKTKGFGFVSFKDPQDFIKATKEMNGRYVGSRPIKLRKSTWKNRALDVVKKKEKEKTNLINMLTGR